MAQVEADIPDRLDMKITRLVDSGEFVDREEAIRELLQSGVRAYQTQSRDDGDRGGMDEPQDDVMGHDDEYVF